jgi:UDP-glucose 4-epimerase
VNPRSPRALVLGASGFLGWAACQRLVGAGWQVVGLDNNWDVGLPAATGFGKALEIHEASVFDGDALRSAMKGAETVFCFVSFTNPATTPRSLRVELQTTLQALESILATMVEVGARRVVFPSSGGTIYGDTGKRPARESDVLRPLSSYGVGKLLSEHMIQFYADVHSIKFTIMRVSNAYGATRRHRTSQGFIDASLERVLQGGQPVLWGSAGHLRDFVFIDDAMEAMLRLLELKQPESLTVNVGTGVGSTLKEVLSVIAQVAGVAISPKHEHGFYAGVPHSVLDIGLLQSLTRWAPSYTLEEGIREAWRRKSPAGNVRYRPGTHMDDRGGWSG